MLERQASLPPRASEGIQPGGALEGSKATGAAGGETFADLLKQVAATDATANQATQGYANGQHQNLHETMLALEKADISFSLLVSVRNKLLEAYREVMRMG
ncbi:MAG: flagellar hook-basal body complex protein FliE [Deltaproteobacteria bacterium]|nr:flagellar hook-basal body complex protein FliE [Deltaproteobacteria bacterium]